MHPYLSLVYFDAEIGRYYFTEFLFEEKAVREIAYKKTHYFKSKLAAYFSREIYLTCYHLKITIKDFNAENI